MSKLVNTVVAIRRKPGLVGLPGDDPINYNIKLGSSIKGDGPLRGLTREEEKTYLPSIINVYPEDHVHWLQSTSDYWNNISVPIPADEEVGDNELRGKVLKFSVEFNDNSIAEKYKTATLEQKAEIIKKSGARVVEGISSYVLFRYCLVYGRVANSFADIHKSARIWFYLYSKDQEVRREYNTFKERTKANRAFLEIMDDETTINALLRMFKINPDQLETTEDKHLAIDKKISENPIQFLDYVKDKDLKTKAAIRKAVDMNIIYNPTNTETYYYGADNEILLGKSLLDAVLFLNSKEEKNTQIRESILAQLKNG